MGLTKQQIDLLDSFDLPTDFSDLSDDQYFKIDEVMSDELMRYGVNDSGDGLNEYGKLCQSIFTSLPDD